ncbi:MAG: FIST N-terminal domain-containing protein, partial [Campylobacterota bacterium]|nr:FIST N-terminal domain-containing protein [Campylobacterota bacterium]
MKTFNTYYTDEKDLEEFISTNSIKDSSSLLIQVFTAKNDKNFIQSVTTQIDKFLPNSFLIGSTTDGEIKDGDVTTGHTVISFSLFENSALKIFISNEFENYRDAGEKLATNLIEPNTKAIISFIDGIGSNGEEFLNGISSIDSSVIVAGGLAGDGARFVSTYIFTKEHVFSRGVVGVSLNSEVLKIYSDYSFEWLPIGVELHITKAVDNRVYTINDKTAYDTYAYYFGEDIAKMLPAVGIEFPLIIKRDGINIARAVVAKEDDGSLIFAGNLHDGDIVMFGYGDSDAILARVDKHYNNFLDKSIESIFIYSCMARRRFMPKTICRETKPFNAIAPTSGFFTYGEFYSSDRKELLNQTMTTLALSESDASKEQIVVLDDNR